MIPFSGPTPNQVSRAWSSRWRIRLRRRHKPTDPRSWNLTLTSVGIAVPVRTVVDSPGLLTAAVEDFQWRLALADLRARRPRWWQRSEMAAWTKERDRLEETRRRIAELAAEAVNAL